MEKLKMETKNLADEKYRKLAELFPNAITETIDDEGNVVRAIDKDVLMQEININVVDGQQERYQFTWPDKKKSVMLANAPITKTLRFDKDKSVGKNGSPGGIDSENIYIEGDNLDALKLLQETYLGKVKMIYIDPPYNTGNDFIYKDNFSQSITDYASNSGQTDDEGNRIVQNVESNGRFHTDWLNMLYPRLLISRNLLTCNGVLCISIDDNEFSNLKKISDEIFGSDNLVNIFIWNCSTAGGIRPKFASKTHEYILVYAKNKEQLGKIYAPLSADAIKMYNKVDVNGNRYRDKDFIFKNKSTNKNQKYDITCPDGSIVHPKDGYIYRFIEPKFLEAKEKDLVTFKETNRSPLVDQDNKQANWNIYIKKYLGDAKGAPATLIPKEYASIYNVGTQRVQTLFNNERVFENVKPVNLIQYLINMFSTNKEIIMDFFSGSATTAEAVIQSNIDNNTTNKFIVVQIPEKTDNNSYAYKNGYYTICDIGEERIRRAGKKIKEETNADIDYGFRCFKVDSSNMTNTYYSPDQYSQDLLQALEDNIKPDRTPVDLLIQVMLDLGIMLSSKIDKITINNNEVFSVENGYLYACFDKSISEETVKQIALKHPFYAVFRDLGMENDSVMTNFDQIFKTYSPNTKRRVI